jgi:uncharacterized alpha-E superfamily protein
MSLLPTGADPQRMQWEPALIVAGCDKPFAARGLEITARNVIEFLALDLENPSSILSCLRAARENARAVRGSITTELWETTNQTWLEFNRLLREHDFDRDPSALFEWVKFRSHLSRGVTVGTMLHDESLHFIRIGTFLERADNTARLLDVKFHALNGDYFGRPGNGEAPEIDFYHWSAILRSVSGFEIYRKVYRNVIVPEKVAELLILRPDMPRSLVSCMNGVVDNLRLVANEQSAETQRRAGRLRSDLEYARIDEILATGMHAYLTHFLDRVNDIGAGISRDFLVPA